MVLRLVQGVAPLAWNSMYRDDVELGLEVLV